MLILTVIIIRPDIYKECFYYGDIDVIPRIHVLCPYANFLPFKYDLHEWQCEILTFKVLLVNVLEIITRNDGKKSKSNSWRQRKITNICEY